MIAGDGDGGWQRTNSQSNSERDLTNEAYAFEMGATRPHNPAARGELLGATAPWRNRSRTKKNKPTLNTKFRILPSYSPRTEIKAQLKASFPFALELLEGDCQSLLAADFLSKWPDLASLQRAGAAPIRRFFYARNSRRMDRIELLLLKLKTTKPLTTDEAVIIPSALVLRTLAAMRFARAVWQARVRFPCASMSTGLPSSLFLRGDSTLAFVPLLAGLVSSSTLLAGGACRVRFGRLGIGCFRVFGASLRPFNPGTLRMLLRFRSRILGIERFGSLAFRLLTLELRMRLPVARSVAVYIYDIDRVAIAAIPLPVMFPSRIPVAYAHPAPRPVTIVIKPRADSKSDSKSQRWSEIRRVRLHIHNFRIVLRHIDRLGFCWHDANVGFFLHDPLLRSIDKVARGYCLGSELLNGIHHVSRLAEKGLADLCRPLKVLIHPLYDIWITDE
jgi:hypothetical protein